MKGTHRLHIFRAGFVLTALGLLFSVAMLAQAATIGAAQNISNDSNNSIAPKIAQDPDGNAHAVWVTDDSSGRSVRYAKGVWNGSAYQWSASVQLAYVGDYQYSTPTIAVAPNGTVMATWSDGTIRFRTWNARDSQPSGAINTLTGGLQPSVATDAGNKFHIVWNGDFQVQYCEWNGSACSKRISLLANASNRPDVAVDSNNNVHIVADTGQLIKYVARASGQDFGAVSDIGGGNKAQIAADQQGNVYIARSSNYNILVCRRTISAGCSEDKALDAGSDLEPSIGATASGQIVVAFRSSDTRQLSVATRENGVWTAPKAIGAATTTPDLNQRSYTERSSVVWSLNYDIQHVMVSLAPTPTPTPTPPPIAGWMQINNGATITNQASVNVVITNTSNTPASSYSLADGLAPDTPSITFNNPHSATFTLDVADGQCRVHTLYGKIAGTNSVSNPFSASIVYDPSAQAQVMARNPNSASNPPLTGMINTLVPTGNTTYTRQENFTLLITVPGAECTGLKQYAVVKRGAAAPATGSAAWKPMSSAGYISALTFFTADVGQGQYQFDVYVEDNAGNVSTTPYVASITYDIEGPSVSGTLTDLPTTSSPKGGVETISIGTRTVTDNLYQGPTPEQSYWGYWVTVKQTSAGAPSEDEWNKYGQIVAEPLGDQLVWNMARGMIGTFVPETNYTVYVRLLDGAGNWSQTLAGQSTLVRQLEFFGHMPLVSR